MTDTTTLRDISLSDGIYAELKNRLILGRYSPGDRLSMRKLAAEFGTSAMPVREALKRLSSEQVIESAAAKAFNVPSLSRKRAAGLFELRALLESAAVQAAHPFLTPALLDELEALCDRIDAHLKLRDFAAYMVDNRHFHFLLYRLADNPDLISMIEQLWMKTGPSLFHGLQEGGMAKLDWNADHKRLCRAMRAGQVEDFGAIMRADVEWGAEFYRA
ncbi:GntR family transcriptional regulator [Roseovarius sp. 2305UL8-3]|uniref:GntR family transcriptional regulator n=1 Tax=Roseovarius conchicola TaxID=3121636 RepID=UPI00352856D1